MLMNNVVYDKAIVNWRNRMNVKLISTKEDGLKWTSKQSCMSQKLFDNDLVAIYKNKVPLTVNKSAYVAMIILYLSTSWRF